MSSGRRFEYICPDINRVAKVADPVPMTGATLMVYCGFCGLGHSGANCPNSTVVHQRVGAGCVSCGIEPIIPGRVNNKGEVEQDALV